MEYEDELERMRDRKRRQKAREQQRTPNSSHPRTNTGREPDMMHAKADGGRRRRPSEPEGQRRRRQHGDYEYERRRQRNRDDYDDYDDRDDYAYSRNRGGYDDYAYSRNKPGDYDDYDYDDSHRDDDDYEQRYGDHDGYGDYDDGYGDYDDDSLRSPGQRGRQVRERRSGKRAGLADNNGGGSGKTQKKKKRKFLLLKILLLLLILAGAYFVYKYKQTGSGYWTVAVFGVDSRNGNLEKGALSDVEMLCVIDRGTGDIKLVSVFRDTYLEINPDGTYHKINEAYFKGGHEQAVQALERNLDLSIDDYATFNWKAVVDAINILGGIDLEISDSEFRYINSFITETVESTGIGSYHLEHAGMNHLDGIQAVAYARLRLMDTDYNRTARQRLVIQLAMNKAKEADLKTLTALVQTILPQISTSIGVDDVIPMARNIRKYHISETNGFPFSRGETYIGKKDCVIPLTLESNVIQLHQILYGTENFQPSETVRQISAKIASDSGMSQVAENAPEAKVLGQKALEGSGSDSGSGSGSGDNAGSSSGNPAPPSQTETASPQTEAPQEEPSESSQESSLEEASVEDNSPGEEPEETESPVVQPSEETEIGPGYTAPAEPEAGPEPSQTEAPTEPPAEAEVPAEKPVEETPEEGPGIS